MSMSPTIRPRRGHDSRSGKAFPDHTAPAYLLRVRDGCYGPDFGRLLESFGTEEVETAPRSPWQNPFVERLIGTLDESVSIT